MALVCRPAVESDLPAIRSLRWAWLEEDEGGPVDDTGFESVFADWWALERGHRRFWLAELDGAAVGMVSVVTIRRMPQPGRDVPSWGYVHQMYVVPQQRSAGVGGALLDAAITECRADGFQQLVLNPRPRSVPFYERHGFAPADHLLVRPL